MATTDKLFLALDIYGVLVQPKSRESAQLFASIPPQLSNSK